MDEKRDFVVTMLDCSRSSAELHREVFIVGYGGVGKTTLAGLVQQHMRAEDALFDCMADVCVSQNPDQVYILATILCNFGYKDHKPEDLKKLRIADLVRLLQEFVQHKRYFLVVDDLWREGPWDTIKSALSQNNSGGRIIATTRIKDLATKCCSLKCVYHINPLSPQYSKELLLLGAGFQGKEVPNDLQEPFHQIMNKCGGVPLAIKTVSRLLVGKRRPEEWSRLYESLNHEVAGAHESISVMRRILSLSYVDLPHPLRKCLLYLSMFPEDIRINRKRLIRRWSAEGFIDAQRTKVNEKGETYFIELLNRNLIQPAGTKSDGIVKACRVHDIILDFIKAKAVEENFVTLHLPVSDEGNKIRRLSIHGINTGDAMQLNKEEISHVRSLSTFGCIKELPSLEDFPVLRVLDMENNEMEPALSSDQLVQITKLFHLKYLAIGIDKEDCLEGIGNLQNLETLYLFNRNKNRYQVFKLPSSILQLRRLVFLHVDPAAKLPDGIDRMEALEELESICIEVQSLEFLQNLGQMKNLKILTIFWYGAAETKEDDDNMKESVFITSIHKLCRHNLKSLSLWIYINAIAKPNVENWFVDEAGHPNKLEKFIMFVYNTIPSVPQSLGILIKLQKLNLHVDELKQNDLEILGSLPNLHDLFLEVRLPPEHVLVIGKHTQFQCLRYFRVIMERMMLKFEEGGLPNVEDLSLLFYPHDTMDISNGFDFGIENVSSIVRLQSTHLSDYYSVEEEKAKLQAQEAIVNVSRKLPCCALTIINNIHHKRNLKLKDDTPEVLIGESFANEVEEEDKGEKYEVGEEGEEQNEKQEEGEDQDGGEVDKEEDEGEGHKQDGDEEGKKEDGDKEGKKQDKGEEDHIKSDANVINTMP